MTRRFLISYLFFGLFMNTASVLADEQLHIAVASNFKQTQEILAALFEDLYLTKNPHSKLKVINSSGSSGTLFAQIQSGAPFDVFLSADEQRPDTLITLGLAKKTNRNVYAQGQIALWQPAAKEAFDIHFMKNYAEAYVLANPKLAPYGAASKALMEKAGIWHTKDRSRILAHNIATAFQYLASGSVKIGWVAVSQLKNWEQRKKVPKHSYWLAPVNDYPPIKQVAVQLKQSKNPALAEQYVEFLSTMKAQNLIKSFGYLTQVEL